MNLWDKLLFWWYRKELNESYYDEYIEEPTLDVVIKRVKLLFKLHGVAETEIPEFYKEITLKDLNSDALLIEKLTPEFLKRLADFFGIRIEWLRSGEPELFYARDWYKARTKNFFEDLKQTDFDLEHNPFEIITTQEKFDIESDVYQPFILVIKVPISYIGDRMIYRYMVESEWHWQHAPCRLGAKAIATRYYQLTGRMIYIYTTSKNNFKKLAAKLVTPHFDKMMNHEVSFEEYGSLSFQHMKESYEGFEYADVSKELQRLGLSEIQYDYLKPKSSLDAKVAAREEQTLQQRAAVASHQKSYQIKRECIIFWQQLNSKISNKEAARRFLASVPDEKIKFLSPNNRIDFFSDAISQFKNKEKTLQKTGSLPNWLKDFNPK